MTTTEIEITEDEFDAKYQLRPNHLNPNASWTIDGVGYLFETYGKELDFVRRQDPRTVWTILEGDTDALLVVSGYHFVNRIGYLVSTVPTPSDQFIRVHILMDPETEEGVRP